jgi:ketosteroid isomerase-like protein
MKKIVFATLSLAVALSIAACGDQAGNKPANAPANSANANKAAAPVDTAAVETEIKKLVTEYAAGMAKNDFNSFDKTTSDNFMFVSNDGSIQTKADRISSMKEGATKYESLTYDDVNVRVNAEGNGAVVIAKATVKGMNMGKPIDGVNRVTQVWSKTKDGWKMASLQATAMTAKADDKKTDDKAKTDAKSAEDDKKADDKVKSAAPANK